MGIVEFSHLLGWVFGGLAALVLVLQAVLIMFSSLGFCGGVCNAVRSASAEAFLSFGVAVGFWALQGRLWHVA